MDVNFNSITGIPYNSYDFMNNIGTNPMILLLLVGIIIVYYFVFSSLGNTTSNLSANNGGIVFLEVLLWGVFIVLVLLNGMSYFFNIDIVASIKNIFTATPEITISSLDGGGGTTSVPEERFKKEVFNIPGNYYNYENAKALCKAYDSELATYDQVENAYNNGAEWCNYGWSANQMALFPTQKQTYNTLQTIKGHENDCGRSGINGGYMANPRIRFGVNCYGLKPSISEKEEELMKTSTPYPETIQDKVFQKRVDFWKNKIDKILISPFNYNIWGAL